ncbi:hypothetical protein CORC01_04667, partial [Colletotrichum orchidophilum]
PEKNCLSELAARALRLTVQSKTILQRATRTVARSALRLHGGETCQGRLCGDQEQSRTQQSSHVQRVSRGNVKASGFSPGVFLAAHIVVRSGQAAVARRCCRSPRNEVLPAYPR